MAENHPAVGSPVIYVDELGNSRAALVTCVWHDDSKSLAEVCAEGYCVNLVIVSDHKDRSDPYGRQVERRTSVTGEGATGRAHGNYWRLP